MRCKRTLGGLAGIAIAAFCLPLFAAVESPVADAAMHSDIETIRSLLKDGVDANTAQGDGMTALHWTAVNGDLDAAKMLLYAGGNLKATTRLNHYTPLHLASQHGWAGLVEAFLDAGAGVFANTTSGATALMLASASGSAAAVSALIQHGAEVNAQESGRGETALMFAAARNRSAVIDVLLRHDADPKITSNVLDVVEINKEFQTARQEREKRVEAERKALVEAALADNPEIASNNSQAESPAEEAKDDETKRPNLIKRFFAWIIPGGGEDKEEPSGPPTSSRLSFAQLVGTQGGMTPLLFAVRQGHTESVQTLLAGGADINGRAGDGTTPLLIATINGHFDLAKDILDQGADPTIASDGGATPLYAAVNMQYAPRTLYPQPTAFRQQHVTHLELMEAFMAAGADVNARLKKKIWYSGFNFDLSNVNETGATPFWRAAYASDVETMRLLLAWGANPKLPTQKTPRRRRSSDPEEDPSGLPPVPPGGPAVTPLQAASGVGYGFGFAANSHQFHPGGMLRAVKFLIEEVGADVNERDHDGYTAMHHAAARGDNEMIEYLVSKGADATFISRRGQSTVDMANGPIQRVEPFPETMALLESLGAVNNHNCVSC